MQAFSTFAFRFINSSWRDATSIKDDFIPSQYVVIVNCLISDFSLTSFHLTGKPDNEIYNK